MRLKYMHLTKGDLTFRQCQCLKLIFEKAIERKELDLCYWISQFSSYFDFCLGNVLILNDLFTKSDDFKCNRDNLFKELICKQILQLLLEVSFIPCNISKCEKFSERRIEAFQFLFVAVESFFKAKRSFLLLPLDQWRTKVSISSQECN